jgi:hypothetical protein
MIIKLTYKYNNTYLSETIVADTVGDITIAMKAIVKETGIDKQEIKIEL